MQTVGAAALAATIVFAFGAANTARSPDWFDVVAVGAMALAAVSYFLAVAFAAATILFVRGYSDFQLGMKQVLAGLVFSAFVVEVAAVVSVVLLYFGLVVASAIGITLGTEKPPEASSQCLHLTWAYSHVILA